MIAVRLMGGLGNQMFQYAAGSALAAARHTSLAMDMVFFDNIADVDTPREYELDCFVLRQKVLAPVKRPQENPEANYEGKKGRLRYAKARVAGKAWHIYREPHHQFDPSMLEQPNQTYLVGYWQTEKYFKHLRPKFLKDFSYLTAATGPNKKVLEQIQATEAVSIHVRRGDYVTNVHASKFHGTKSMDYYQAALKKIVAKAKNPTLFVFSDDPKWCMQNLKFSQETVYVEGNEKGFEDMRLMSQCKHNIIANSSFSWWAAWLNQNPDKLVVAPRVWFNDPKINTSDVIPETWIKV